MEQGKRIARIDGEHLMQALNLAWEVFLADVAPDYSQEGVDEFWSFIDYEYMLHRVGDGQMRFWAAFDDEKIVGVLALREMNHISLLFVAPQYQGQGVAKNMLKQAVLECQEIDDGLSRLTVNASIGSVGFYEQMGFVAQSEQIQQNGMIFTPMALTQKQ